MSSRTRLLVGIRSSIRRQAAWLLATLCLAGAILASPLHARGAQNLPVQTLPAQTATVEGWSVLRKCTANLTGVRAALSTNVLDSAATLEAVQMLLACNRDEEALAALEGVLRSEPENYDIRQRRAFVLFRLGRLAEGRSEFERLSRENPADGENKSALEAIARAERDAAWRAAAPPSDAPPATIIAYAELRLKTDPEDSTALELRARGEAARQDFAAAVADYRRVAASHPADREAALQLARLLIWNHQPAEAAAVYHALLGKNAADRAALKGLAEVAVKLGNTAEAAAAYGKLADSDPGNTEDLFAAARLEAASGRYPDARARLTTLLSLQPANVDARLLLAQIELRQGQYSSSLRQFESVLARRSGDMAAAYGVAEDRYYTGDLARAEIETEAIVDREPRNFDAVFLLASIERARGRRLRARLLLDRASRLAPHNPAVVALGGTIRDESSTVLHLNAGFARELGGPAAPGGAPSLVDEDLRAFSYSSRVDFTALPRSSSSVLWTAEPVESPSGLLQGSTAPTEFMYRQTTRVDAPVTLRGGIGLERLGPGVPVPLPGSAGAVPSATRAAVGYFGGTYALNPQVSFDLTWSRAADPYTPLAVRLGVLTDRIEGGANVQFDSRTDAHVTYFKDHLFTEPYWHASSGAAPILAPSAAQEHGSGGTIVFSRRILNRERLALDGGVSALMLGYDGPIHNIDLGLFTPRFYQRELVTSRLSGSITRRLGYDLTAGLGVQQVDAGQALKRALTATPSLKFKASRFLSIHLGYSYYNSIAGLGVVRGNGVLIGIDWKM